MEVVQLWPSETARQACSSSGIKWRHCRCKGERQRGVKKPSETHGCFVLDVSVTEVVVNKDKVEAVEAVDYVGTDHNVTYRQIDLWISRH